MRFNNIAALASASLVGAVPAKQASDSDGLAENTAEEISNFEVQVLGGMTLRADQVYNDNFFQSKRGPRAYVQSLRKYSAYGATVSPQLQQVLDKLLADLGLGSGTGSDQGGGGNSTQSGGGRGSNNSGTSGAPNGTASSNGTAGQGEVSAIPQAMDSEYLAAVSIGTPPQTIMLDFDTGSSDLWVFSSETDTGEVMGQKVYNASQSSTSESLQGATWSIEYGDGSSASGVVFTDSVTVGGVTVQNQAVEAATNVSGSFTTDQASSGLLGLAMNSINQVQPTPQKTFFSNAMAGLAMPLFTANLKAGEPGNYNFGFVNKSEFTGNVNFVPVNTTQGFWQFSASGFSVGNGSTAQTQSLPHQAIADTGTTLMLVPDEAVEAYYKQIPSAQNSEEEGGYVFSCNDTVPDFTAIIGGYNATVPGDIIRFAPVDTDSLSNATECFGGLQSNTGLSFAIYGDIFLKGQFTVFDGGNTRIGFAAKSAGGTGK